MSETRTNGDWWFFTRFSDNLCSVIGQVWALKMASTVPTKEKHRFWFLASGQRSIQLYVFLASMSWLLKCSYECGANRFIKEIKDTLLYHTLSYMRSSVSEWTTRNMRCKVEDRRNSVQKANQDHPISPGRQIADLDMDTDELNNEVASSTFLQTLTES